MKKRKRIFVAFMTVVMMISAFSTVASAASASGVAKVSGILPLIGIVNICTPYTATYTKSNTGVMKISKVTTKASYTSAGISLMTYTHYDTWAVIKTGHSFDVYAQGHVDFAYKGCPISLGLQTFLKSISL